MYVPRSHILKIWLISFDSAPSVISLKKAMQTYARQGGTSAIFVHDDGLQLLPEAEREKRINFYADHNLGWVARPPHSNEPDGFKRAGRFKKASNMNYGLALSLRMERILSGLEERERRGEGGDDADLEERALQMACEEVYEENGQKWRPWAAGGKSIRVGELILIVDSDTVVPEVCRLVLIDVFIVDQDHVPRTASVTLLASSPNVPKSPSYNTSRTSCRSPITISKTASLTLRAVSTSVYLWRARTARWLPSLGTTPSYGGVRSRMRLSSTKRTASRRFGARAMSARTLTWRCDSS